MSEAKNLPWGEKHLCGYTFTVKITIGEYLYHELALELQDMGLVVNRIRSSKKTSQPKYMVYGVITGQDKFDRYLLIKEQAQFKRSLEKTKILLKSIMSRSTRIKENETVKNEDGIAMPESVELPL